MSIICSKRPKKGNEANKPAIFLYGYGEAEAIEDYDDSVVTDFFQAFKKDMLAFTSSSIPKDFPEPATPVQIEYDWTGIMGYTKSGCSIVGRISLERPSEFL